MVDGEEGTTKHTKGAKEEKIGINRRRSQMDADIFLRRPGSGRQARPPGNREKLSGRTYSIVQDLFFFRKALMKNM
jgi:hypothetical protein